MSEPQLIISQETGTPGAAVMRLRDAFAQRHVPLSGALADTLERFLTSRQPLLDPFWGRAFGCMVKSLGVSGAVGGQSLMLNAMPRFPLIVAEPVLRHAARRTGLLPLVGYGLELVEPDKFREAQVSVQLATQTALTDPEVMGKPFWVHAALDLLQEAHRQTRARARTNTAAAPDECDPALAALVFLHPPRFDLTRPREQQRQKAKQVSAHRRAGIRPKEGGVAGIRQSRSLEDLPDGLFSEMIQPRMLLANKLLHEGLLVRHRPPRRDPRRDLLAVTLQMADRDDGMALLVKAAWADAAVRLRVALSQMGLANSDLIWSQQGCDATLLDCQLSEPGMGKLPPLMIDGRARADLLMRSGMFPAFAVRPQRAASREFGVNLEGPEATMLRRWKAGLAPLAASRRSDPAAVAADYGRRMVMLCRPAPRQPDWSELRAEISATLGRGLGGKAHMACLTWNSGATDQAPELSGFADGGKELHLTLPQPLDGSRDEAFAEFMGPLVLWMMDVTLEALDVTQA